MMKRIWKTINESQRESVFKKFIVAYYELTREMHICALLYELFSNIFANYSAKHTGLSLVRDKGNMQIYKQTE